MRSTESLRSPAAGFFAAMVAVGAAMLGLSAIAQETAPARAGVILTLDGPVTPAAASYLEREIAAASDAGKELVVVEIDTPSTPSALSLLVEPRTPTRFALPGPPTPEIPPSKLASALPISEPVIDWVPTNVFAPSDAAPAISPTVCP